MRSLRPSEAVAKFRYEEWTYAELMEQVGSADGILLLRTQGISTRHELFLLTDDGGWPSKLVYIVAPDSGPLHFLTEWPELANNLNVWDFPEHDDAKNAALTREVLHWVVDQAQDEVDEENGLV